MKAGTLIAGKFRLTRPIGEGAMGAVWEATHEGTSRQVAVKFIVRPTAELRQRLLREAKACGALQHRNIVDVYDVGTTAEGDPFMVMQLLVGETLADRLVRLRRLPTPEAARIARDIARALAAAHAASIVHRDLKPANVFLHDEPGEDIAVVKVVDFGVSKNLAASDGLTTVAGGMVGSPAYMSPEQAGVGGPVDARADLWSLGVLLFEMLAGRRPFQGDSTTILPQILTGEIPSLSRYVRNIDEGLVKLVARCLERDLSKRIASATDLATQLQRFTAQGLGSPLGQSSSGWGPLPTAPDSSGAPAPRPDPALASPRSALVSVHEVDPSTRSPRPQGGQIALGPRMPGAQDDDDGATAKLDPRMLRPGAPISPNLPSGTAVIPNQADLMAASRYGAGLSQPFPGAPPVDDAQSRFGSSPSSASNPRPAFGSSPEQLAGLRSTERLLSPPAPTWGASDPTASGVAPSAAELSPFTKNGTVRLPANFMANVPSTNLGVPPAPPPPSTALSLSSSTAPFVPVSSPVTIGASSSSAALVKPRRRTGLFIVGAVIGIGLAVLAVIVIRMLTGASSSSTAEASAPDADAVAASASGAASGSVSDLAVSAPPLAASSASPPAVQAPQETATALPPKAPPSPVVTTGPARPPPTVKGPARPVDTGKPTIKYPAGHNPKSI